jgi:Outer membrane protein beta-barrel domain
MSKRPLLTCCVVALTLAVPELAWAQAAPANCPPGSWFCAETSQVPAAPAGQPVQIQTSPAPPVVVYQPPPPVVVYQQAPRQYYAVPPPPPTQVYYYHPRYQRQRPEWGLNLHFEGAAFGAKQGVTSDGIWGGGLGLRYRPVPVFALETDFDFVSGVDYNGYQRNEYASTINGLFFLNPRSRAQVYLLAGFGWSWADIDSGPYNGQVWDYFGGQGGLGVEFRASRHVALNFDARGFIRTRIDGEAQYQPEFANGQGQTTNTSAGVLFTGGLTFYF